MSCIFQLPFTQQRPRRTRPTPWMLHCLGQLETRNPAHRARPQCAQAQMLRHPRQWQEKRDVFIPEHLPGRAHWVSAAGTGHHAVFRKRKCASPSKMASSLETKPQQESPSEARVSTLPAHLAQGQLGGSRVGPHLATPPSPNNCHKMVAHRAQPVESGQGGPNRRPTRRCAGLREEDCGRSL